MKIKKVEYRVQPVEYHRYDGGVGLRYQPQHRAVVLGVPMRWKNFDVSLTGVKGTVWFNHEHKAEQYIGVVADRERRK